MHIVHALQPGGMELGVLKIVNGLDARQIQSSICSTAPADPAVKAMVSAGVPVFELGRRPGNDPRLVWELYALFRREQPTIVHTHSWGTLMEGLVAARVAGVPIIVHGEHGTLQGGGPRVRVQRWAWGRVTQVLSVSYRLADRMSELTGFPAARIVTIQNGVDFSRFSPELRRAARQDFGIPEDVVAVGTAGRLVPVKDQATLLEAFAHVRDRGVSFRGFIAGDGPLRATLEAKTEALGLKDRVRLLGQREDIERYFAALDVFVLSSRSEGMSNTILEAMASRVPVVATDVGGADELVDDRGTGLLVPPQNAGALAAAVERMVREPELRRQMGEASYRKARSEFSLDRMLTNYLTLYRDLVRGRAQRA